MRKLLSVLIVLLSFQLVTFAQNFNKVTEIIDTKEVTIGQAAYLVGVYLEVVQDGQSDNEAFEKLKSAGYFSENVKSSDLISLKQLCALYAKATNQKGGLLYTWTKKSERYSFKEFFAKGYLPKNADPMMKVSGIDAIGLLNNIIGF